ncbi:hypothetical protein C8J56DRAFT_890660 [Mycena floridula]|nr:hypothetical protein C8J56DRAFT_890660 [Mycena floridula]
MNPGHLGTSGKKDIPGGGSFGLSSGGHKVSGKKSRKERDKGRKPVLENLSRTCLEPSSEEKRENSKNGQTTVAVRVGKMTLGLAKLGSRLSKKPNMTVVAESKARAEVKKAECIVRDRGKKEEKDEGKMNRTMAVVIYISMAWDNYVYAPTPKFRDDGIRPHYSAIPPASPSWEQTWR